MLRVHTSGFPDICKRLALISVHMSKRSNDLVHTSPEPAAKRQRILTSAAGLQEDVKVWGRHFEASTRVRPCPHMSRRL